MSHTNDVQLVPNSGWDKRILICRNAPLVDTFIVITQRYVVLVDTLINPATAAKMMEIAQPYLENGRSLLVVNTHADYDHCWGNQLFSGPDARFPAPIIGSGVSAALLADPKAYANLQEMQREEPDIFGEVILTPPTITFDQTLSIAGGDLTLEIFMAAGHTPDHAAIYIPEIKTLLAADAAEVPYPMARQTADLPLMRASLAKMAGLAANTVLYCHAPVDMGDQLLHDNIAYFDYLERACRAALAQGMPADPAADADVIAMVGLPYAQAVPQTEMWQNVHTYYQTDGHAHQLRGMLAWLATENEL